MGESATVQRQSFVLVKGRVRHLSAAPISDPIWSAAYLKAICGKGGIGRLSDDSMRLCPGCAAKEALDG